jgi:hypothetical protein
MDLANNPAFLGAVAGLGIGLLEYVIIMGVMGRFLSRGVTDTEGESVSAEGRAKVRQSLGRIKPMIMFGSFVIFPVTGYLVGKQFAS